MARYWYDGDPAEMEAVCDRVQAEHLAAFDHHGVIVGGCWGILMIHHWMRDAAAGDSRLARVLFNPAPRHSPSEDQVRVIVRKHPPVPREIQALIDRLVFRVPSA
jgi:hypothetical protein